MKKIALLALSLCFAFHAATAQIGGKLPNTSVQDVRGMKVAFNTVAEPGKVTLISFWATWCIPCIKEIKAIQNNLSTWREETPDFNYVTVSMDDSRASAQVKSYAKSQRWDFPVFLDPNSDLKRSLNFETVPFTIIVDKNGEIAFMHSGYETGGEHVLYEKVKELAAAN